MITWQPGMTIDDVEKLVILKALAFYQSKTVAALSLGITVKTIYNKLHQYDIPLSIEEQRVLFTSETEVPEEKPKKKDQRNRKPQVETATATA